MSVSFTHETLPQRVVFASFEAAQRVAQEVARLGASRPMVIAAEGERDLAGPVVAALPDAVRHTEVVMHVPSEVAVRARMVAVENGIDVLVSVGGGSTTGLAKAVALTTGLRIVAVPTTYAGSEATNVWGVTEGGRKNTGTDDRVLPRVIVYDASMTLSLPVPVSVASGLNAVAHCVDSMWAPRVDPINQAFALEGIRVLRQGLADVARRPQDIEAREQTLTTPISPRWPSPRPARDCITRSAMSSAACTTSHMRRLTPWSFRTFSHSTRRPSPTVSNVWRLRSTRRPRSKDCAGYETRSTHLAPCVTTGSA